MKKIVYKKNYSYIVFSPNTPTKSLIALTAPHSFCLNVSIRTCDTVSSYMINCISRILTDLKVDHIYHKSWTLRQESDMNRKRNRTKKYREMLTSFTKKYKISFNLDIHSTWREWKDDFYVNDNANDITKYTEDFLRSVSIGINKPLSKDSLQLFKLTEEFKKIGRSNDIQDEFRANGIDSILIEFEEFKRGDDITNINSKETWSAYIKKMHEICKHACFWIYKNYTSNRTTDKTFKIIFGKKWQVYSNRYTNHL